MPNRYPNTKSSSKQLMISILMILNTIQINAAPTVPIPKSLSLTDPQLCFSKVRSILKLYNGQVYKFDGEETVNSADVGICTQSIEFESGEIGSGTQGSAHFAKLSCVKVSKAIRYYSVEDSRAGVRKNYPVLIHSKFCINYLIHSLENRARNNNAS